MCRDRKSVNLPVVNVFKAKQQSEMKHVLSVICVANVLLAIEHQEPRRKSHKHAHNIHENSDFVHLKRSADRECRLQTGKQTT